MEQIENLDNNATEILTPNIVDFPNTDFIENENKPQKKYKNLIIIIILLFTVFLTIILFLKPANLETIKDSVVMVKVYDREQNEISTGSGFCVFEDNCIVTNFHVIDGAYSINIITNTKETYPINCIISANQHLDIAIMKGTFKLKPLKVANTKNLKVGDEVIAVGSPEGQLNNISTGIISQIGNNYDISITAPISPGSSGGVLLNKNSKVIGITYASYNSVNSQNLNYAINAYYLEHTYLMSTHPNLVKVNTSNYSNYFENLDSIYFSTSSVLDWYYLTGTEKLLEKMLPEDWCQIYLSMNKKEQDIVHSTFNELEKITINKFDIENNISNWSESEFFLNLNLLDKYELSVVLVDVASCNNQDEIFNKVNSYNLPAAHKTLILYLFGGIDWAYIHNNDKESVFDYFCDIYDTNDLGAILETLNYRVEYNNDGSLTAWW